MNINLRALVFGTAVAAALTVTMNVVSAAEMHGASPADVIRLDAVEVTAHREAFDANGNLKVVRLDGV